MATIYDQGIASPRDRSPNPSYGPAMVTNQERGTDKEVQQARAINLESRDLRGLMKQREISADNTVIPGFNSPVRDDSLSEVEKFTVL